MAALDVISADSHVQEPLSMYRERLPATFRHRVPRIEERDGALYYVFEGKKPRRLDIAESRIGPEDELREFRDDASGGTDIARRLADLDRDGIAAEVIYPNHSLFLYNSPDPEYQMAVARAYNDWAIELFGGHRERFVPVAVIPVIDIAAAAAEVERAARLGYRAVKVPIVMNRRPYNDPAYERLWSAAEANGAVLHFHAFSNSEDTYPEDWGEAEGMGGALNHMAMSMADGQSPVSLLISSGALERHPRLRFVVVECGAGWLAWLLHVLDEQIKKKHMWIRPELEMLPSEFFARQGHVTFSDDPVAVHNIRFTGPDCLLWGSDYPHDEGTFPHSQEVIARIFAGVPESVKRKVVYENAARLYGFAERPRSADRAAARG
ncbi:MAG TPA: amidohydrolase family protein [Alphaproteobacteria bacterium]|nr:amidohydrolase family protein [Alphaproteobacteria bacterium]